MNVLIIGAGAIGLQSARLLAQQGCQVTVLDQAEAGTEASWAGGGIVSPLYPWRYSPAVTALAHWSQDAYPQLAGQLLAETGLDPQLQVTGLYWLDLEDEADALTWAGAHQRPLNKVAMPEVYRDVPVLGEGFASAIFMAGVANIRNPRLLQSLKAALHRLPNVQLVEQCPATGFVRQGSRISGVRTPKGIFEADRTVVAAGAWSSGLLAGLGLTLPVRPMKGQMILFRCAEDFLPRMVMADGRYAIPRRDGHILVGSTLEDVGFDKTPTAEALDSLLASAHSLLPALEQARPVRHWAGLRPGSPEGIPFIGAVPELEGLWLNCGHFRNGLVLAPASCQLLADLLLERPPLVDPQPYQPVAARMAW